MTWVVKVLYKDACMSLNSVLVHRLFSIVFLFVFILLLFFSVFFLRVRFFTSFSIKRYYVTNAQWKNFENPLKIDKVFAMKLVYYFLGHSVGP